MQVDAALIATGRSPFTKGLGLEKVTCALTFQVSKLLDGFAGARDGTTETIFRRYQQFFMLRLVH